MVKIGHNKDPESGKVYDVVFDVTVKLAKGIEKNMTEPNSDNKHDTYNYIKVNKSEIGKENRSFVKDSHKGEWRGTGRNGKSLADDDPAPHEFGHLLGLPDLYLEGGGYKHPGHKGNIMAEPAMEGKVWQGNIDRIVSPAVKRLNSLKENDFKKQVRKGERSFYFKVGNKKD